MCSCYQAESQLLDAKDEMHYLKRRETDLQNSYVRCEAEDERKQKDLEEVQDRMHSRKENSPSVYNYLAGMMDTLRRDLLGLNDKMSQMDKQVDLTDLQLTSD